MKTCAYCGRMNTDQATKCQECGTDLVEDPAPAGATPREPSETERFEKVAVLDNEVQAELMDGVLSGRDIPHILQSYHDSALDGLYQAVQGWGVVLAPASFKQEILAALEDVRRQSQSPTTDLEGDNG
jgi:hypothetical protein